MDAAKAVPRKKFIVMRSTGRKKISNNLTLYIKEPEKETN